MCSDEVRCSGPTGSRPSRSPRVAAISPAATRDHTLTDRRPLLYSRKGNRRVMKPHTTHPAPLFLIVGGICVATAWYLFLGPEGDKYAWTEVAANSLLIAGFVVLTVVI